MISSFHLYLWDATLLLYRLWPLYVLLSLPKFNLNVQLITARYLGSDMKISSFVTSYSM